MAVTMNSLYWYATFCCCLATFLPDVLCETENCKLRDYDTRPGSACACGENVELSLCYPSRVIFYDMRCDLCRSGNYFNTDVYDCRPCRYKKKMNCEDNVWPDCRPCEDKTTLTTTSTESPTQNPTTTAPSSSTTDTTSTTVSTTTAVGHSPGQSEVKESTKPEEGKKPHPTTVATTTSEPKSSKVGEPLSNLEIFLIALVVAVVCGVFFYCVYTHRKSLINKLRPPSERISWTPGRRATPN